MPLRAAIRAPHASSSEPLDSRGAHAARERRAARPTSIAREIAATIGISGRSESRRRGNQPNSDSIGEIENARQKIYLPLFLFLKRQATRANYIKNILAAQNEETDYFGEKRKSRGKSGCL
ncbi:hypothetical protein [Burkholderia sp. ABCPW 111]|uniref:hypothetical protein n=1 Tax=Burkholderia sp. ABCPW 111 TaxID=1820025 RepID=UPI001269BFA6|nr:hypothetical protein [Burkholderia sp. ABCPW 111]